MVDGPFIDVETEDEPIPQTNGNDTYAQAEEKPEEVTPRIHHTRTEGSDFWEWAARGVGTFLIQSGKDVPVGRVVSFQAPITGKRIDGLLANTWIDTILQPLFRKTQDIEGIGMIVAMPVLVGLMERQPAMAPMLGQMLRPMVYSTFDELAPIIRKERAADRRKYRTVADDPEYKALFGLDRDDDPFEAFMASVFGVVVAEPGESE